MSSRASTEEYPFLAVDEAEKDMLEDFRFPAKTLKPKISSLLWLLCLVVAFAATGLAGFFFGELRTLSSSKPTSLGTWAQGPLNSLTEADGIPFNLGSVTKTFISNRTFLERPSEKNDALWASLYPKNHGLFEWPDEKPERASFASFHQLHCVDALRKSWYTDFDIKNGLRNGQDVSNIEEFEADHVLHCVEFLRQSIMCHADTTIQMENSYRRGIIAFGAEYQCKDWFQLVNWVDDRNIRMFGSAKSW